MPTAYSYRRFSSEKQAKGDSLRRQAEMAQSYIERHPELNLALDETRNLTDEGMSAYKGVHKTKGALGVFIRAVEDGQIERGSYLLVESFDRLSRQAPSDAAYELFGLVRSGIVVVTLNDGKVYSSETMSGSDAFVPLITSVVAMSLAHMESVNKGIRVSAAWDNKRDRIKDGVQLTKRVPFWLNPDRTEKPDRVELVRRIYRDYASGIGTNVITRRLNQEGIPRPTHAKFWHSSSVVKTLRSKAVIGVLTTGDGAEHPGYYPAIIDEELFHSCQLQATVSTKSRTRSSDVAQPLSGLLRCGSCGDTIVRATKTGRVRKDGTRLRYELLCCSRAKNGAAGCVYKSIPYASVLSAIRSNVAFVRSLAGSTSNIEELRNIDGYLAELDEKVMDAFERWKLVKSTEAQKDYQAVKREQEATQQERAQLLAAVGTVGTAVTEMLMEKPEMTNQWLRKVFKSGVLDPFAEKLTMTLQNGQALTVSVVAPFDTDDVIDADGEAEFV